MIHFTCWKFFNTSVEWKFTANKQYHYILKKLHSHCLQILNSKSCFYNIIVISIDSGMSYQLNSSTTSFKLQNIPEKWRQPRDLQTCLLLAFAILRTAILSKILDWTDRHTVPTKPQYKTPPSWNKKFGNKLDAFA